MPAATFGLDCHASREERDLMMATWLEEHGVELVVLAGYMHLLTKPFLDRFPGRIVNVHPSLLPEFPGAHAVDDALAAGVAETGVTVHLVDEGLDTGPVLRQEALPVEPRDTLLERLHAVEHRLLPEVVRGPVPRALISVHDKHGVAEFAQGLAELGWELVSSGGTAAHLEERGIEVTTRRGGDPGARRCSAAASRRCIRGSTPGSWRGGTSTRTSQTLAAHEIEPFDLVCVNLYPFAAVAARRSATEAEVVEMIDVGGPSMLRAAAKNFAHVARRLERDAVRPGARRRCASTARCRSTRRRELARDAFAATAAYESAIATWFAETESFPDQLTLTFRKAMDLSYGENPHQAAAFYREAGTRRHLLSHVDQLGGKELSYNNLVDLEGGRRLLREFALPAVVIVKHANPCGVAVAGTIEEAWERALAADPVSAFGCVALLNRPVFAELGARIAGHFVEVLMAPGYDDAATDVLAREAGAAPALEPRPPRRDAGRARLQARPRRPAGAGPRHRDRGPRRR